MFINRSEICSKGQTNFLKSFFSKYASSITFLGKENSFLFVYFHNLLPLNGTTNDNT